MAGYSKRSLVDKLGIQGGFKVAFVDAPRNYRKSLGKLPKNISAQNFDKVSEARAPLDFIHAFSKERKELESKFSGLKKCLSPQGMLWISWPKGAAKVKTDLDENIVREIGLKHGLVDVKVCAVDEIWSGLKFVYRLKDRPQPAAGHRPDA